MAIVQNVETVLLADRISTVSQTALEQVSQFYSLDKDNLKAELKVFTNLLKEKKKNMVVSQPKEVTKDTRDYVTEENLWQKTEDYRMCC